MYIKNTNEIWEDYLDFIKRCGVCTTMKQFHLRQHYKELYGLDVWQDYFDFMIQNGFYDTIDFDYKNMFTQPTVKKILKKTNDKHTNYIRFLHKKNDKLLYNLTLDYDCIIKYEYGKWYIHIPYVKPPRKEPMTCNTMVGLDPGLKTFQTFFSQTMHGKIQQTDRFKRIRHKIEYLNTLYYGKKRNRIYTLQPGRIPYKKFIYKTNQLYRKQSNLAMQLHYDTIRFLTGQFNWIFLPSFNTQEMVKGNKLSNVKHLNSNITNLNNDYNLPVHL